MKLEYDNRRTRAAGIDYLGEQAYEKKPGELFEEFYEKQNGMPMTEEQRIYLQELIESIWEESL